MSTRTDLATAAGTVEGLTAYPYFVQSTNPGTVFVRLDRIEYPNPFGGIAHWNVVVILPSDLAAAEKEMETKLPLLTTALEEHMVITSVQMQQLQVPSAGTIPVLFINGHREAD